MFYESLPDDFWNWYETVKAQSTEIISLTIRVKRKQISMDYLDTYGKPKRAKFLVPKGQQND